MIRRLAAGVLLLALLGVLLTSERGEAQAPAGYEVRVQRDVMVPMRDGVRLATDLYLPVLPPGSPAAGRLPTVLNRTPYNKATREALVRAYAARGYAAVCQDTRGRYASEGIWHMLTDDAQDGVDTCAWIGKQPWSNGRVGTVGASYEGGTQHAIAMEGAPELKTAIPVFAMANLGYQGMRNAGAFELRFWNWIFLTGAPQGSRAARDPATRAALQEMSKDRGHYLQSLPLRPGTTPLRLAPEYEEWLVQAMEHGGNDAFWKQNNLLDYPERYQDLPLLLVSGWYDSWGGNTTANYRVLKQRLKSPVHLVVGPWHHNSLGLPDHDTVAFGPEAAHPGRSTWMQEWMHRHLKGDRDAGRDAPFATRVRIFVMGTGDGRKTPDGKLNHGGYWRDEREWPLARARATNYYLHADGSLRTTPPAERQASTSYDFDPRDPVPTIGGNLSSAVGLTQQGAWDQRGGEHVWNWPKPLPLSARRDVVVFRSEPLAEDLEVTGELEAKLWAASSAPDTDFTAKLIDVYPPSRDYPAGFDLNLEDGIVRARFRESLKAEKLMQPGRVYPFTIRLYPTSNIFKKGHRIRVDVSSSNFPRFDVNPNTGEPLNRHRRLVTATNTLLHDRGHPSHIVLPVIPAK